jgi:hypothetical protein
MQLLIRDIPRENALHPFSYFSFQNTRNYSRKNIGHWHIMMRVLLIELYFVHKLLQTIVSKCNAAQPAVDLSVKTKT